MNDQNDDRTNEDDVEDAIRARQSLEDGADPGDVLTGHAFTTGERLGALGDFENTSADEALDDDDVELGDDD